MKLLLIVFVILGALQLFIWTRQLWHVRTPLSILFLLASVVVSFSLIVIHPRVWTGLVGFFTLYRAFNLARIIKPRMHEQYLRQVTFRSSLILLIANTIVIGTMVLSSPSRWYMLGGLQFMLALVLLFSMLRHVFTTREPLASKTYTDRELPTLSVAIPARNETEDLELCLRSLLANSYPKLEILVLDDCSSNSKTPEIIRSFAHDGVRFVAGTAPDDTWLAKNWAYERLMEEANGEILLFCGVDTRFTSSGLRQLVSVLLEKNKSMLSVLPHNTEATLPSQLVQPLRYGWELALPRRLFQRPPVLSTCWLIKKSLLESAGGFKAVSRSIVPESYFARTAAVHDGYSFIRSNDVISHKSFAEQRSTAIRTRYPQLHRRPELVAFLSLAEVLGIVGPIVFVWFAIYDKVWFAVILSVIAYLIFTLVWAIINTVAYGRFKPLSLVSLPVAILLDVYLMHYAMCRYEFSEVIWKGRNVCIPVMHVVPKLPALTETTSSSE